jgi:hypothetical protein
MNDIYRDGSYLSNNSSWHEEDSPWKVRHILGMLARNRLAPTSICEIGCGAGEILRLLREALPATERLLGYEISPQAFTRCLPKAGPRLSFVNQEAWRDGERFALAMAIDVFEHVDDYLGFLRQCREKGEHKLFHIPLDLSVQTVFRRRALQHARERIGHLHYFTRETALASLTHTGHSIVDVAYTAGAIESPHPSLKRRIGNLPRRLGFALSPGLTARTLGGCSLLVLTR